MSQGVTEWWDVYDRAGNPQGTVHPRGTPMALGAYHLVIEVLIFNEKGETLLQQRSPQKKYLPQIWGGTTGCVQRGECSQEGALRELNEELGLAPEGLHFVRRIVERLDGVLWDVYFLFWDGDGTALTLQEEEVMAACWVSVDEAEAWYRRGQTYQYEEFIPLLRQGEQMAKEKKAGASQ